MSRCSIFLVLSAFLITVKCSESLVKVSIYYESYCPDSEDFIARQLYPHYNDLKDSILLDFVPYGKASQIKNASGSWIFTCQHGAKECNGNKYEACALDQKKGQQSDLKFINCAISLRYPSDAEDLKECATSTGYDWTSIKSCYDGNRGNELLASYGDRTHSLNPRLTFVPTVIYNDVFDQTLQDESMYDFVKAVCTKIPLPKPNICKS